MSEELSPYNDFFKKKLENQESSLPDDMFDNIMRTRFDVAHSETSDAPYKDFFQKKLGNHESFVAEDVFDHLMHNREGSDELPADTPLRKRILAHSEAVTKPTFEAIIEERERRRRALVWRFAAAMLLFFTAYLLFLNKNTTSNDADIKTNRPAHQNNDKAQVTNELSNNTDITTTVVQNKDDNNQSSNHSIHQSPNSQSAINNSPLNNIPVQPTVITNLTQVNRNKAKTANSQNTVSNSTNFITEHTAEQQTIIPTIPSVFKATTAAVMEPNNFLVEGRALEVKNPSTSNAQLSASDSKMLTLGFQNLNPSFDKLSIFNVKNIAMPSLERGNPCADPGDGCPTFGKKRNRGGGEKAIYVDVYGAPEYAFRRLSENLPEMTSYLKARDTVESPWYAFSAGARASVVFESGLALRTGFVYNQTNEIAVFDSLGIGKRVVTETYVPRAGGGQDTIRKTEITSGIFRTTKYNRYRSIDIPLQLGFEFPLNDYWSFSVNGGANFNLSAWRKADILSENRTQQAATSGFGEANPVFRNALGFSIFGSVAAYRQLSGNVQLVIEPSVRHYLQPITRSDFALKQAYTNAGLIIGVRYRL